MSNAIKADEFGFTLNDWATQKERLNATLAITERIQAFTLRPGKGCAVYVTIIAPEEIAGHDGEVADPGAEADL